MEKKMILLSILRDHDMHGYQMNEILTQDAAIGMTLKKANAYKLLNQMASDGWIIHREEREGNRPPRRVYALTPTGEAAFQRLLRESLREYAPPQLPSVFAYNHLNELPAAEALALLRERRQMVNKRFQQLETTPQEMLQTHLGMVYMHAFYATELEWLDGIIKRLQEQETNNR